MTPPIDVKTLHAKIGDLTPTNACFVRRADFTGVLLEAGIAIGMDGNESWRGNVFIERLWRSVEYEEVSLRAYHRCRRGTHLDRSLPGRL